MNSELVLIAGEAGSVGPTGYALLGLGAAVFLAGWLWLAYQNSRFGAIHGALSLIPPYALLYGFFRMEHRRKDVFLSAFLIGMMAAGVGGLLVVAANVCAQSADCSTQIIGELPIDDDENGDESSDD